MRPGRPLRAVLGLAAGLALHAQALQTWTLEQGRVAASPAASAAPLAAGSLQKPFVAKAWAAAHPGAPTPRLRCTRNAGCWFTAGHGVILDSVNHFNHQGFHFATQLKTAEDRMAYAMDHMGITYSDLRDFVAKKTFDAPQRCEKEVTDESAFRFISNFVRFKRKTDL